MRMGAAANATLGALLVALALAGCVGAHDSDTVRLGYFPNLTHAQALYGLDTGAYAQALGPDHPLKPIFFTAGPAAMEALLTGQVDLTYVGPSPTLNALVSSSGDQVRVIAGGASGGARFIVTPGLDPNDTQSLAGKTFATPQLGNTQDVSMKNYLAQNGLKTKDHGGSVQVLNAAPSEILTLFSQHRIDGAWVPEPWATRMEKDAGGVQYLDERDLWPSGRFVTTQLVTTQAYIDHHPDVVAAILKAHVAATQALQKGGADTLAHVNGGIKAATGQKLDDQLLASA